jgi:hypothetical protein
MLVKLVLLLPVKVVHVIELRYEGVEDDSLPCARWVNRTRNGIRASGERLIHGKTIRLRRHIIN